MKKEVELLISLHGTKMLGKEMILLAGWCNLIFSVHPKRGNFVKRIFALSLVTVNDLDCFERRDLIMVRQCLGELKTRFED